MGGGRSAPPKALGGSRCSAPLPYLCSLLGFCCCCCSMSSSCCWLCCRLCLAVFFEALHARRQEHVCSAPHTGFAVNGTV